MSTRDARGAALACSLSVVAELRGEGEGCHTQRDAPEGVGIILERNYHGPIRTRVERENGPTMGPPGHVLIEPSD